MKTTTLPPVVDERKLRRARSCLPGERAVTAATLVFEALSHPMRLRIVHALTHDELTVGDLAHALSLSMSAVSHHLAFLRRLRLVAARDEGRKTYYRVADPFVAHLVHDCLSHVDDEPRPVDARRPPRRASRAHAMRSAPRATRAREVR